jgi:hypothetical protein
LFRLILLGHRLVHQTHQAAGESQRRRFATRSTVAAARNSFSGTGVFK